MYATKLRIYLITLQNVENLSKLFSVDFHFFGGDVAHTVLHHDLHRVVTGLHVAVHLVVQQVVLGIVFAQDPSIVGIHVIGLYPGHVVADLHFQGVA